MYESMQWSQCKWYWNLPVTLLSRKLISMPINSLNCNRSFAVMICVILICGNFVEQLKDYFYLIAAREGCVLLKGHRRGTLPGLTAPNLHQLRWWFSVIWFRTNEQDFLAVSRVGESRCRRLWQWSERWLQRWECWPWVYGCDWPDMICWIMFVAQISFRSSLKTTTNHDMSRGIKTIHDGMKATQFDQDIQCRIYEVKASGIHVYDMQIMEWYHPSMLLHMDNRYKAWPKGAIPVQWAR